MEEPDSRNERTESVRGSNVCRRWKRRSCDHVPERWSIHPSAFNPDALNKHEKEEPGEEPLSQWTKAAEKRGGAALPSHPAVVGHSAPTGRPGRRGTSARWQEKLELSGGGQQLETTATETAKEAVKRCGVEAPCWGSGGGGGAVVLWRQRRRRGDWWRAAAAQGGGAGRGWASLTLCCAATFPPRHRRWWCSSSWCCSSSSTWCSCFCWPSSRAQTHWSTWDTTGGALLSPADMAAEEHRYPHGAWGCSGGGSVVVHVLRRSCSHSSDREMLAAVKSWWHQGWRRLFIFNISWKLKVFPLRHRSECVHTLSIHVST